MALFHASLMAALMLLLAGCATRLPQPASPGAMAAMQGTPARMIVLAVASQPEAAPPAAGSTARYHAARLYSASGAARATLDTLAREYGLKEVAGWPIEALQLYCVVVETMDADAVLQRMRQDGRVALAQPLNTFQTLGADGYNDPYLGLQAGFRDIDAAGAQRAVRAAGNAVKVAVIDTGVDTQHPDLQGRVLLARSFVDAEGRFERDRHGTEVAGIIAANANNAIGIVGVAPQAQLLALKACWPAAGPDDGRALCNTFTLSQALVAAMNERVQVINLSLGGPADPLLAKLVGEAVRRGIAVVGAVPPNGDTTGFPVGVPGVIGVDAAGRPANAAIVHAPGRGVLTLRPGGHYDFASGSSLATAHVSGVVALLLSGAQPVGARQIHAALMASRPAGSAGGNAQVINACRAVANLYGPTAGTCR